MKETMPLDSPEERVAASNGIRVPGGFARFCEAAAPEPAKPAYAAAHRADFRACRRRAPTNSSPPDIAIAKSPAAPLLNVRRFARRTPQFLRSGGGLHVGPRRKAQPIPVHRGATDTQSVDVFQ